MKFYAKTVFITINHKGNFCTLSQNKFYGIQLRAFTELLQINLSKKERENRDHAGSDKKYFQHMLQWVFELKQISLLGMKNFTLNATRHFPLYYL